VLEPLNANAKVATLLSSFPSSTEHRGIRGAADEAVLNKVQKLKKILLFTFNTVATINREKT
jgi:hypothetical protein